MEQRKNLCAQVPLILHTQVTEAREALGQTTSEYITNLLTEYFEMKKHGGKETMATNSRTMAFQISEDLFQRIKAHLERESVRIKNRRRWRRYSTGQGGDAISSSQSPLNSVSAYRRKLRSLPCSSSPHKIFDFAGAPVWT